MTNSLHSNFIAFLSNATDQDSSVLGGKGYSLTRLINNRFNVPDGFIINTTAFDEFINHNHIKEILLSFYKSVDNSNIQYWSENLQALILAASMPQSIDCLHNPVSIKTVIPAKAGIQPVNNSEVGLCKRSVATDIEIALQQLGANYLSIRSSAISEDGLNASFAGLFDTYLNVQSKPELIANSVKRCWASLFNDRAIAYKLKMGASLQDSMAVVVQTMIPAQASGITFTKHPINDSQMLIEATYGVGDMIVSGKIEPDSYSIDRESLDIADKNIGPKTSMTALNETGVSVIDVPLNMINTPSLSDGLVLNIASVCMRIEKTFGSPQDIEWCICDNVVWILQSRAITRM